MAEIASGPASGRSTPPGPETRRLYDGDWGAFGAWCLRHGWDALPAAPATVAAYLAVLARSVRPGTLARYAAAINDRHRRHGHAPPGETAPVQEVLRQARAARDASPPAPTRAARRPPPTAAGLAALAVACPGDLAGLRDRALLLLLATSLDKHALLGLDRDQVRPTAGGTELVLHPAGTGDGAGDHTLASRVLALRRGAVPAACPVRALQAWLQGSDTRFGPVFRPVDRWGTVEHTRLTPDGLRRILRHRTAAGRKRRRAGLLA